MFDNMTDKELIHEFDVRGGDDLTRALAERLDMRQQPQSVFRDIVALLKRRGTTITADAMEQCWDDLLQQANEETYNLRGLI